MIGFFEVVKRALNGPYYAEQDSGTKAVVPKLREVVAKYDVRYDPGNPVADDDKLADDLFQAGLELYTETGCYCTDTSRGADALEHHEPAPVPPEIDARLKESVAQADRRHEG